MIRMKKVIACDLDGTLTESKAELGSKMVEVLAELLKRYSIAVVSGGAYKQFQKQFLSKLNIPPEFLKNLYLFPTMGSTCYVFDLAKNDWIQIYNETLSGEERQKIKQAFDQIIKESKLDFSKTYGDLVEDRGSQVTFSGCGQEAPIEIKKIWDPDQSKRQNLIEILKKKIPEFEIRVGGATSIDVTKKGIDKAYTLGKIKQILEVGDNDIVFIGDALYKGGNDSAVKKTEVDFIETSGPKETIELLRQYI